jgi:serine/threonine-protein kinase
VVHRDLKPSNILVTADGTVTLLDFGIAKLLEPDVGAAERTELTDAGGTLLTPGYAAPEQVTGSPITAATDVYALGVLAYLLLTGVHPAGMEAGPAHARLRQLLERDPPPVAEAVAPAAAELRSTSLPKLRRLYAGDLGTIVAKALEKDPARRYSTAAALRDDLDSYLRHEPIRARPASRGYRVRMFVRRNRLPVTLGAAVVVTLVAATAVTWNRMIEARRQRDEAHAQRDRALFEARRATAASGFMQTMLSTVGPNGRALTPTELLDEARTLLERDFAAEPAFAARMLVELSSHHAQLAQASATRELRLRAVELAQRSGDREAVALASCALAGVAGLPGAGPDPVEQLRTARAALRGVRADAVEPRLACLIAESRVAGQTGATDSAIALARRAIALAEASGDTASQRYIDALDALEAALAATGDVRQRLGIAGRRAAVYTRIGRGNSLGRLAALRDQADALMGLGEYRQADSAFALLAPIAAQVDTAFYENFVMIQAATIAEILGRPSEALAVFDAHLQTAQRLQQRDRMRWLLLQRITSLIAVGRIAEAEASYASALLLTAPDGSSAARRAELDVAAGRFREGFSGYLGALEQYGFPEMTTPHRSNRLITRAARAALLAGDPVAADSLTHHALRVLRRLGQDERRSGEMGLAMLTLARAHLARRDSAEALRWARRAVPPLTFGFGEDMAVTKEAVAFAMRLQRVFASSQ